MAHDDPSQFPPDSEHEHEIEDLKSKRLDYIRSQCPPLSYKLTGCCIKFCFRFAAVSSFY